MTKKLVLAAALLALFGAASATTVDEPVRARIAKVTQDPLWVAANAQPGAFVAFNISADARTAKTHLVSGSGLTADQCSQVNAAWAGNASVVALDAAGYADLMSAVPYDQGGLPARFAKSVSFMASATDMATGVRCFKAPDGTHRIVVSALTVDMPQVQ